MQFGRIQGVALVVLGILLVGVQGILSVLPKNRDAPAESPSKTFEQKITSVPGIIGATSLVVGVALFATARRRAQTDAKQAVK
jgi:hypothetical protein